MLAISQIAEPVDRQPAGISHTLFGKPLDVSRKITPRPHVQIVSGHAAIDPDRFGEWFGNVLDRRHPGQRMKCCRRSPPERQRPGHA